ncbi:hypothetical protein H1R82_07525 [Thermoactinomyces intermedius]|jgi:hypothetical protein|uniref:MFS transporter n=4 Tax=Thermoactinomyces TaxID=2023 RepID=A0A8I1ACZ3_THEIN|nr:MULTISPECIES: hypothetical protein [Thermoactinomyces]MBA4550060.1 hypothetical protein [Thermoactinomyces intermedius]MBA4836478.1 hypothetical protein [Thermoactinomyces intermedius]MBH8582466.1 hypothetical protein [Thermoactinomyces sp. CICC 10735]MBH8595552.1 hypothetical protein [Thermoactinomyces intermedius]
MLYLMRLFSGIIIPLDTYMLQMNTTEAVRGRVFSLHMATYGGVMQLSYIVSGWAYEQLGISVTGLVIGIISFLCGIHWLVQYRLGKFVSHSNVI